MFSKKSINRLLLKAGALSTGVGTVRFPYKQHNSGKNILEPWNTVINVPELPIPWITRS